MKSFNNSLFSFILACFVYLLNGCATANVGTTMADASVPESEQCLILINNDAGLAFATLLYINEIIINKGGGKYYIPAGTHTLGFKTGSSSAEYTERGRIDTLIRASAEILVGQLEFAQILLQKKEVDCGPENI